MNDAASLKRVSHRPAAAPAGSAIRILVLAAFGLTLISGSLRAEERILTLTVVNFDSLLRPQSETVKGAIPMLAPHSVSFQPASVQRSGGEPFLPETFHLSASLFGRPPQLETANPVQLTRNNGRGRVALGIWNGLEAGYGQIFIDRSELVYAHHGTGWEEPRYGYLKISFDF